MPKKKEGVWKRNVWRFTYIGIILAIAFFLYNNFYSTQVKVTNNKVFANDKVTETACVQVCVTRKATNQTTCLPTSC